MKTRILILAIAILASTTMVFANPVPHENTTDCEKKVLKKIQRTMRLLHVKDYLDEGQKGAVIVTCFINENNEVEVARIDGSDEDLKAAVVQTLNEHPVKCKSGADGNYFTFRMAFQHVQA